MLPMNVYPGTILKVFFLIFRGFFNLNLKYRYIIIFFLFSKYLFIKSQDD